MNFYIVIYVTPYKHPAYHMLHLPVTPSTNPTDIIPVYTSKAAAHLTASTLQSAKVMTMTLPSI